MAISVISDHVSAPFRYTPPKSRISPQGYAARAERLQHPDHHQHSSALQAMRPAFLVAQCLGLLPFRCLENPRFEWISLHFMYHLLTVTSVLVQCGITFFKLPVRDEGSTSLKFVDGHRGNIIHQATVLSLLMLYLRLSRHWGYISGLLLQLEHRMAASGYPDTAVSGYIRKTTVFVLVLTFVVEVVIDTVPAWMTVTRRSQFSGINDFLRDLFLEIFPTLKDTPGYNYGTAVWAFWSKTQTKYVIAYGDLLLWILSAAVAARFQSLNVKLKHLDLKATAEKDWQRIRENYNDIVELTVELDRFLGPQILVTYAAGLWFVCAGVLLLLESDIEFYKSVYILSSMLFWCVRVTFATLSMSSVYEENQLVRNYLYEVPTCDCSEEVSRFTMQASHNNVGLTGMQFFTVTRSVLLTLAGTVASYEVVLMEFSH